MSTMVRTPQAKVEVLLGQRARAPRFAEQVCLGRLPAEPEAGTILGAHLTGVNEGLVDVPRDYFRAQDNVRILDASDRASWGNCNVGTRPDTTSRTDEARPAVVGAKVALDILFPNLAKARQQELAQARVQCLPGAYEFSSGWPPREQVPLGPPRGPPRAFLEAAAPVPAPPPPPFPPPQPEADAALDDDGALDAIWERVAALALGPDAEDEPRAAWPEPNAAPRPGAPPHEGARSELPARSEEAAALWSPPPVSPPPPPPPPAEAPPPPPPELRRRPGH